MDLDIVGIIGGVSALLVTIGGGVKYMIIRNDKKKADIHAEEIEERNREREDIKERITNLESKVEKERKRNTRLIKMIASCEHQDCQVKGAALSELDED